MDRTFIKRKKHPGMALLVTVAALTVVLALSFGAVSFISGSVNAVKIRTGRAQTVIGQMTAAVLHQIDLYSVRFQEYARANTAAARAAAAERWLTRSEVETKGTYSYEEIKERFGTAGFDAVDRALAGLSRMRSLDFSILEEGRAYEKNEENDGNGFLTACRILITLEMEEGAWISPITVQRRGRVPGVTETWKRDGVSVIISMRIKGDAEDFWTFSVSTL